MDPFYGKAVGLQLGNLVENCMPAGDILTVYAKHCTTLELLASSLLFITVEFAEFTVFFTLCREAKMTGWQKQKGGHPQNQYFYNV